MKNETAHHQQAATCWMIVDDNDEILSLLHQIFARFSDAKIVCFNSPQAALAAFEATPESFELVVTDFEMPGINGVELCHRLHAVSPPAKIVLATGSGTVSEEAAAQEGFCGLLNKPFPFATLKRVLENIGLGKKSGNTFAQVTA